MVNLRNGRRSTYIPPIIRLAATLETLGGGGYQWLSGNNFGVALAQSTLSKIVSDTSRALQTKLCPLWIKWRISTDSEKDEIKRWFYQKFSLPGVVGCVDGTHIFLQRPREEEQMFFNRKGKHSLNTMIVCDHKLQIMAINARYAGSAHDSLVWKHSNEREYFVNTFNERNHNCWLLGESGYPLEPWLLAPYRSSTDEMKTRFNGIHAKARNVVERCIGVYKGRWRILLEERKSSYDPLKMAVFANVCAALHNICIQYNIGNDTLPLNDDDLPSSASISNDYQVISGNNRMKELALKIRDDIKNTL